MGLYALVAVVLLSCWVFSLIGGGWASIGSLPVRVTSWKVLRWVALVLALGLAVDPDRSGRAGAASRWFEQNHRVALFLGLCLATIQFCLFKVTQYMTFETGIDLTQSQFTIDAALRGRWREVFGDVRSYLTGHFSPLHLLLAPFYALLPRPETLLVLQGLAAAAAAAPLYGIARHARLSRPTSALVALVYLNNPILWRAFTFDFHIQVFAPLFVFATILAALRRRWGWFYAFLFLTLTIVEEMALVLLGVALLILQEDRRSWRHALAAAGIAGTWILLVAKFVLPWSDPHDVAATAFLSRWSHLGGTKGGALLALARDPALVARLLASKPVRVLLISLAGLPILQPALLATALAVLVVHLSSNYDVQSSLGVYYALPATTLLFAATPLALATVARRTGPRAGAAIALAIVLAHPGSKWAKRVSDRDRHEHQLLASVPRDARISAQAKLIPHLPISRAISLFPERAGADWVLLDARRTPWPLTPAAYRAEVGSVLEREDFGVVEHHDGIVFLQRAVGRDRNAEVLAALDSLSTSGAATR
jgi:uncharacterized membrane protein